MVWAGWEGVGRGRMLGRCLEAWRRRRRIQVSLAPQVVHAGSQVSRPLHRQCDNQVAPPRLFAPYLPLLLARDLGLQEQARLLLRQLQPSLRSVSTALETTGAPPHLLGPARRREWAEGSRSRRSAQNERRRLRRRHARRRRSSSSSNRTHPSPLHLLRLVPLLHRLSHPWLALQRRQHYASHLDHQRQRGSKTGLPRWPRSTKRSMRPCPPLRLQALAPQRRVGGGSAEGDIDHYNDPTSLL